MHLHRTREAPAASPGKAPEWEDKPASAWELWCGHASRTGNMTAETQSTNTRDKHGPLTRRL
ncbi:protein of unknown function [Paraburkholderia kururiensis]